MYIARKRLQLGDGYREAGDPVPEAASWGRGPLGHHLRLGWIEEVPDPELVFEDEPNFLGATVVPGDPWGNVRREEPEPEPKPTLQPEKLTIAELLRIASAAPKNENPE